jgi:ribosome-associated protein YbcJ (S4-like RNA binding protein)
VLHPAQNTMLHIQHDSPHLNLYWLLKVFTVKNDELENKRQKKICIQIKISKVTD